MWVRVSVWVSGVNPSPVVCVSAVVLGVFSLISENWKGGNISQHMD